MKRFLIKLAMAAGLAGGLAACNHDNNNTATTTTTTTTPTTPTARFASFGNGFATDFSANANSEPVAVTSADLNPVSTTTEPSSVT